MEKSKNSDSVKSDSLQSLSASTLDKLRIESERKNDSANKSNCESQSSKQIPLPKSQEIDNQISELACLISRLQDEIVELSRNATKNPSLIDSLAKDDDKKTQTLNLTKTDRSSGYNECEVENTTVVEDTVHTEPPLKDSIYIDAEYHQDGIKNVVNIDKAPNDDLHFTLMNCSQVASETKPDPFRKPPPDNNLYNNVYQLNMENGADENEDDNLDDGEKIEVTDNENETEEYPTEEIEHGSEFDFGSDIGDTTVVEYNFDDNTEEPES